jgi:DNA helicase IV
MITEFPLDIRISASRMNVLKKLVDAAYAGDKESLIAIGDAFYCGDFGNRDSKIARYIYDIADGKKPKAISQYIDLPAPQRKDKQDIMAEERHHLERVLLYLDEKIEELKHRLAQGFSAYFLEIDIQDDKIRKQEEINQLTASRFSPYYARFDVQNGKSNKTVYIGENRIGSEVVSVWSDFGRHYRAKNETAFDVAGVHYAVKLRRNIDIQFSTLIDIFDEFVSGSNATSNEIFDPFLQKVLQDKRGEKNISNIIRSIQKKQNDIIEYDFNKSFIIQGCAGSGKTMILLHRLANLKYNRPETDWKRVKIITPNPLFNTYIDAISENLGIKTITRCSLAQYYVLILERYSSRFRGWSKVHEDKLRKIRESVKDDVAYMNFAGNVVNFIYSTEFANRLRSERDNLLREISSVSKNINAKGRSTTSYNDSYASQMTLIENTITDTLLQYFPDGEDKGLIAKIVHEDCQCALYAKVLALYFLYGKPQYTDTLLCIDEGQGITYLQYRLIQQVNNGDVCFNIYGDINQQLPQISGIETWRSLQNFIRQELSKPDEVVPIFTLEENYRNSQEIVQFYNEQLQMNDRALGISINRQVKIIEASDAETICKLSLILKNRVVIISNFEAVLPVQLLALCVKNKIETEKASFMTVAEVRGLEFDTAIVFENEMTRSEKYIAFTRSLSELYIVR